MLQHFDEVIPRENTDCSKYDDRVNRFGRPDVLPMWVADMDFRSPTCVQETFLRMIEHGVYGYHLKTDKYLRAIIDWFQRRHGYAIARESIFFTPGVVPALSHLVQALTKKGDRIIVQPPVYAPFFWAIQVNERRVLRNQLLETGGEYAIDFDDLEAKAREARMLILCSPHNPIGRVWRQEELARIADICLRHNVIILSDEIHNDLVYGARRHVAVASLSPEVDRITVTCHSASKTFNLAGLSTAYILINSAELRMAYKEHVAPLHIEGLNPFGLRAMEAAFRQGEPWLHELLEYLFGNYNMLRDFLKENLPKVRVSPLEGTYLVWLDFRGWGFEHKALRELIIEKARLGLHDGLTFGPGGEGFQRMNIACPRQVLRKALEQLRVCAPQSVE
ncbi:MAG TPA: PatB family C-S lyase [archaeon]|nr:PatB family C-S lyase [archaeon]